MEEQLVKVISEKRALVPLSRRLPFFYVEKSKIFRTKNHVSIISAEDSFSKEAEMSLPVASIGALLIGPGCSISTEATRVMAYRGCQISFTGGGGVPFFLSSNKFRSPKNKLRQVEKVLSPTCRLDLVHQIMKLRADLIQEQLGYLSLVKFPTQGSSSPKQALAAEGGWMKAAYTSFSTHYGVEWKGKEEFNEKFGYLNLLNSFCYDLALIAIDHLGFDSNIGILHGRTKGGGLVFDLADIFKPVLSLETSFEAASQSFPINKSKSILLEKAKELDVVARMVKILERLFIR